MTNPPGSPHDQSPWAPESEQIPGLPPNAQGGQPPESPTAAPETKDATTTAARSKRNWVTELRNRLAFLRDPLSVVLIVITVVALTLAGTIGAELYGRHVADGKVTETTECEVEDGVSVQFGAAPPFLWQHVNRRYTNIFIQTAGNRLKDAISMQADLRITDVRIKHTGDSAGTIGTLVADVTWPADGIKQTVKGMIPFLGNLVQDVVTHPNDGTIELKGPFGLGGVVVKPEVDDGALSLQVVKISGLAGIAGGVTQENAQVALNTFGGQLIGRYPLGIRPDSLAITATGVEARFSARDAPIPLDKDNPCFANL